MNSFLLSKNPPAAVWKTALRMLGIVMLSFLFIPEGWGQGNQALNVSNITIDGDITLTYRAKTEGGTDYAWFYKVGSGGEKEFNKTLTGMLTSDHFFTIQNSTNENTTAELTLDHFNYSGTNGVFRITGPNPVKITANNACTLESEGTPTGGSGEEIIMGKSVIYVGSGSNLELYGGGDERIIVRNEQEEDLIYGLYNGGTTTLSGTIVFIAKNGSENSDAYAIYNPTNSTLKATTGSDIRAVGDDLSYDGTYQSPFMCWHFNNALEEGKSLSIKQVKIQGETDVSGFVGNGESTTFLILGEVSASYAVYLNRVKLMGKKQDNGTGKYEDSYTNTFAATTDGAETNTKQQSVYGHVTAHPTVYTPNELKTAITSSSTVSGSPTKITFGNDIDLTYADFRLESYGKHIEIDGGGHTIKPTYGYENFIFPADGGNSSLTLTNITVDCQNTSSARTYPFINVKAPNTTITLGDGFRMKGGESLHGNEIMQVYGINMQAGTLIMKEGAVITGNTDQKGAAIGITSGATLKLEGGKIESSNGSTGLYLKKDGNSNPQVIIEQSLANSQFDGICLADYLDAQGDISDDVVISASTSPDYPITEDDLSKLGLKAVLRSNDTPVDGYELYLDTDNNKIKLRKFPLLVTAPTFDDVTEGYSQPAAKPITIQNTTDSEITITSVTLANSNTDFTITEPTSDDEKKVSVDSPNTHYTIQPIADLSPDTYTATIEVTADGRTYTAEVSLTVGPDPGPGPGPDDPAPTPTPEYVYYQVVLPQVTGATTDPVAGTYVVGEGDAFRFNLTLDDDYNLSVPAVQAGDKVLQPDAYGYYLIPNVWHDQAISITGIALNPVEPPSANADLDEPVRVWSEGRTLYIHTTDRETIRLYTFGGRLLRQMDNAGRIAIPDLPEGNYLIRVGDRTWKVAL